MSAPFLEKSLKKYLIIYLGTGRSGGGATFQIASLGTGRSGGGATFQIAISGVCKSFV
jgi:hypothetical protein